MPIDPQAQAFLDQLNALGQQPLSAMPVAEARRAMDILASMRVEPAAVRSAVDRRIPGPAGEIPVRIYTPSAPALRPPRADARTARPRRATDRTRP